MQPPPDEARHALLKRACGLIRDADIEACTVCIDPGYPKYVARLVAVRRSGGTTGIDHVDWEPIFHATDETVGPNETTPSRHFRLFTSAIGILHPSCSELLAANSLAVTLVEVALAEPSWALEVYAALDELRDSLASTSERETAFASLACLLLASATEQKNVDLLTLAERILEDELPHHGEAEPEHAFLWSCTNFCTAFPRWKRCIEQHMPTSPPELASLRVMLLDEAES